MPKTQEKPKQIEKQLASCLEHFINIRAQSEELCKPLEIEDYVVQPFFDASPPKWHLGHTTWFYETFILDKFVRDYKFYNEGFNKIFNSYYKSIGEHWFQGARGTLSRPTVKEIYAYREFVTKAVKELYEKLEAESRFSDEKLISFNKLKEILVVGLHHEQQHQELLVTDIKSVLAANPLLPVYFQPESALHGKLSKAKMQTKFAVENKYITVTEGLYEIGVETSTGDGKAYEDFTFDNEGPRHKVYIPEFSMRSTLVTNAEYLDFIEDGGYEEFSFWLSDGFDTVKKQGWQAPCYWTKLDNEWHEFTLHGLKKLDLNQPVSHVSFYEADAFAKWSKKRLPREEEWELASQINKSDAGNFMEDGLLQPCFCNDGEPFHDLLGNVWEWTSSAYLPYPGYSCPDGAFGEYNSKFMTNQRVLRGGSCATPKGHIRESYRNFFYPDKRWQFTGIRLAKCGKDS